MLQQCEIRRGCTGPIDAPGRDGVECHTRRMWIVAGGRSDRRDRCWRSLRIGPRTHHTERDTRSRSGPRHWRVCRGSTEPSPFRHGRCPQPEPPRRRATSSASTHTQTTKITPVSDYYTLSVHPAGGSVSFEGGMWQPPLELDLTVPPQAASIPTFELLVCTYAPLPNASAFGGPEEVWHPIPAISSPKSLPVSSRDGFYIIGDRPHREIRIVSRQAGIFAIFREPSNSS
jgi:hypothetical protein